MKALILVGGQLSVTPRLLERVRPYTLVVAADGGARHAHSIHQPIDHWVGDFDSSDPDLLQEHQHVPRQIHPRHKDQVDFELALETAQAHGATSALVVGAFGGRFDHSLTMALIAARQSAKGFPVCLESGFEAGWPIHAGLRFKPKLPTGTTFSLIALETIHGLDLSGAKWPLNQATLEVGIGLGMSNITVGSPAISLRQGLGLLIAQFETESAPVQGP